MTTRLTWYPAMLPSATPLEIDSDSGAALRLLKLTGVDGVAAEPVITKGPSQEGVTALDVKIGTRVVGVQALIDAASRADMLAARAAIARAMVNIPVRFGDELELGRLLLERTDMDDLEIYALARAPAVEFVKGTNRRGLADLEWLCPYPYWQETADTTLTVPDTTGSITGDAGTDVITATEHDLSIGDAVTFTALTGGSGLSTGTTYYVITSGFTANAFKVSTTPGGSAVDFSTNITDGTVSKVSTAVNDGDVDAPILALIYGAATEVTLTNVTTGEEFTVAVTLTGGTQWLAVDTTPGVRTVRKYTSSTAWTNAIGGLDLAAPRLWSLRPGNNLVRLTVTGADADTRAVLTWRNRFAGI